MGPKHDSLDANHRAVEPARHVRPANAFIEWKREATASTVPHRFQQQARVHPDRTAVGIGDHRATYKTLDSAANRVAQTILARRGKANQAVAILLGNDAQMFEAILGALKAGKFYVPLDPSYPTERNKYIADDVSADLIITNSKNLHVADRLLEAGNEIINLDELDTHLPDDDPNLSTRADDIAFIHYTSGSTGQPKGVIYTHRNVLHIVLRYSNGQHISSDDRLLLLSSYSYGASVGNIFSGLLNGAAICVFDINREGLDKLEPFLIEEDISIYYSVPTVFRHFAGALIGDKKFPKLRLIRLGGESVYKGDVELYQRHFHEGCLLHVGFGTTETNLVRECFFNKQTECHTEVAPVGYPVEDVEVLVLDERGETVGFDAVGEIAVRSRYISPGYWRRPELTKGAFLPDPEDPRSHIYLTGDLGRMLPDGCLIHIGRKDSQVKVRGFRVEASEVEAALLNLKGVIEAVVMAREGDNSEKRLAAYVVLEKGSKLNPAGLRAALRRTLPDFMIPTAFTILDELPRTPSGKVERNQMPSPAAEHGRLQSGIIRPRNPVEARLVQVWEQVLGVSPIGIRDDFFNLGGDSLAAAELFAEIEAIYGRRLSASTLLEASTIELVAVLVVTGQREYSSLVPIRATGSSPSFFCVHGIGGEVIGFRQLADHLGDEQPFYGLRAGMGNSDPLSVEAIAGHYVTELQRVQPRGPYFLGGYSFGGTIAFEMARQLVAQDETVGLLALFDTYGPGYPKLLPVRKRLLIHLRKILRAEPSEKLQYLRQRILINAIRINKGVRRFAYRYGIKAKSRPPGIAKGLSAAHQRASWGYAPKPYDGRLDLFRAIEQKEIWQPDSGLGWGGLAVRGIQIHDIPGDHSSIMAEPNVSILAARLGESLSKARREAESGTCDSNPQRS
jgi:amino acid adenylation domain-containing protein